MKKLAYLFTAILFMGSAFFTQIKSKVEEPKITDTWDAELGFCHGEPTDCYEMIEV